MILWPDNYVSNFLEHYITSLPVVIINKISFLREVGAEIPKKQLYSSRPTLVEIFASNQVRDKKIYQANQEYGYTLKEIASHLHLHYTTISKIISKM